MPEPSLAIELGGQDAADLQPHIAGLEVELSDEAPATFRLTLRMHVGAAGEGWILLDEERFRPWSEVVIKVGFDEAGPEEVLRGYVTVVSPRFDRDADEAVLEVAGVDAGILMDRQEKLKAWPGQKDSDIARTILGEYGFGAQVQDTEVVHDEALSTIVQRETDYQFLRRLALRNGFACWVEEGTAHFGPVPAEGTETQPLLDLGDAATLRTFTATVDALRPAQVAMHQLDRMTGEVLTASAESLTRDPLGELDAAALLPAGVEPGKVFVARNAATGVPEMTALCQGLFDEGAWLVSGEGRVDARAYGHVLRPRALVTLRGIGETYSGEWYVGWVRHSLGGDAYVQHFRARRDALLPTGRENFSGGGGLGLL